MFAPPNAAAQLVTLRGLIVMAFELHNPARAGLRGLTDSLHNDAGGRVESITFHTRSDSGRLVCLPLPPVATNKLLVTIRALYTTKIHLILTLISKGPGSVCFDLVARLTLSLLRPVPYQRPGGLAPRHRPASRYTFDQCRLSVPLLLAVRSAGFYPHRGLPHRDLRRHGVSSSRELDGSLLSNVGFLFFFFSLLSTSFYTVLTK